MRIDLFEAKTDYAQKAIEYLNDRGITFSDDCPYGTTPEEVINALKGNEAENHVFHAFVRAKDWLKKYLVGIARMIATACTDEDGNVDPEKATQFLVENKDILEDYLNWVKDEGRDKAEDPAKFDREFMDNMSIEDVRAKVKEHQDELDAKSKEDLANADLGNSDYELIPIDSFEQMNDLFGGDATGGYEYHGDTSYKGSGWCHTNGEGTYDSWVQGGKNRFFVLAKKGWENIPYNEQTSVEKQGADDYGNSLMALLVNKFGDLKHCTLRCNHVGGGNLGRHADNKYKTYGELSKVTGMDVESAIKKYCETREDFEASLDIRDGVVYGFDERYDEDDTPLSVVIPEGVTGIKDNAFDGGYFENIKFPSSMVSIGARALNNCKRLKTVEFSEGLTSIGNNAFRGCESLGTIVLPESLSELGSSVFSKCTSLTKVSLAGGLTEVSEEAFTGCSMLSEVILGEGIERLDDEAFAECTALERIHLPESIFEIGDDVFSECSSLVEINLPRGLKELGAGCFDECKSLTSIAFPSGLEEIPEDVCANCESLTSVSIPDGVFEIGALAFSECTSLERIVIPSSVERIGKNAFARCSNLTYVTISDDVELADRAFHNTPYSSNPQSVPESVKPIKKETKQVKKGKYSMLHEMLKGVNQYD